MRALQSKGGAALRAPRRSTGVSVHLDASVRARASAASSSRPLSSPSAAIARGFSSANARDHERRRLVRRKEVAIVVEHDEVVARDQSVRRVAVDDVDLAGGERLILHRRTERANIREVDAVGALESGQAIGATDEIRRESGAKLRRRFSRDRSTCAGASESAVARRTAMAYVFSKPSGASHRTPYRARNSAATRWYTAAAARQRLFAQDREQARCPCTRDRRRWPRRERALNAISVAPSPGRRSTRRPRASSNCANISASRYDSPNGLDATTTGSDLGSDSESDAQC